MTITATQTTQVYQVFIKATPEAIWDAITKPEFTERYFYGARIQNSAERHQSLGPGRQPLGRLAHLRVRPAAAAG